MPKYRTSFITRLPSHLLCEAADALKAVADKHGYWAIVECGGVYISETEPDDIYEFIVKDTFKEPD